MPDYAGSEQYTWDDTLAVVGKDPGGAERLAADPIERGAIRRFCQVLELTCPLHRDEAVARAHGYQGLVAPVTSLQSPFSQPEWWIPGGPSRFPTTEPDFFSKPSTDQGKSWWFPAPLTTGLMFTAIENEYFGDAVVGDRLSTTPRKLLSVKVRDTSVGSGAFVVTEESVFNQSRTLIAQHRATIYFYNPKPAPERAKPEAKTRDLEQAPYMQTEDLLEETPVDWSFQRTFEDVQVGEAIPPVPLNITFMRYIEWASANQLPQPGHSNPRFAHELGAPDIFANNVTIQNWWERAVREYIGLDGRIKKIGPFRIVTFAIPGDQVVTTGSVKRKWQEGGENLIELEVVSSHKRSGICVGPGPVIVTLPSRR